MAYQRGGFDCEFVEKPRKAVQSECPVCLLVLREPYQATCCGYGFCRVCIERIRAENKPCPCCKAEGFDCFEDKGRKRLLNDYRVHCANKKLGCQWVGDLGELENHLNHKPPQDKQLEGCQFTKIQCLHCSEPFLRSNVEVHQNDQCLKRPFSCNYCKSNDSSYEDVTTNHWPVCGSYPVQCPNKCSNEIIERQNLGSHLTNHCPLAVVDCDFKGVGCEMRLPCKDLPTHLTEGLIAHVSLLTNQVMDLKKENIKLKQQVEQLTTDIQTPLCPVVLTMTNFQQHKEDRDKWYSPPFYTHPKGYKMCLLVYAGGCGDGANTHISPFLLLMRGEYDYKLEWPLRGRFNIQLLYQDGYEKPYTRTPRFDDAPDRSRNRVVDIEKAENAWGFQDFLPYTELKPKYLQNNCLNFRVERVD